MNMNKKILSGAVVALLVLSMLAAAVPTFAAPSAVVFKDADGVVTTDATVGEVITVSGATAVAFSQVDIFWGNTNPANLLNTTYATAGGDFECEITVPSALAGTYVVVARDSSGTGSADLTVNSKVTATPTSALPGDQISVSGSGYAANSAVTLTFGATDVTPSGLKTTAAGTFSAVFTVPAATPIGAAPVVLTAEDAAANSATASITVNFYVKVTPVSGNYQPGMNVVVSGRIEANKAVTVTFGGSGISAITAFTTTSDGTGAFSGTYQLPAVLTLNADYDFTATWTPTGAVGSATKSIHISANAPEITDFKTQAGGVVTQAVAGAMLVISGQYFTPKAEITISFAGRELNTTVATNAGAYSCNITIPDVTPGTYTVTAQDEYGVTATKTFTVLAAPVTNIAIGSNSYIQGDTISFTISSTENSFTSVSLEIRDPSNNLLWAITNLDVTTLPTSEKVVLYEDQVDSKSNHITLPSDAAVGTWNWTITYISTSEPAPNGGRKTGLFTVSAGGIGEVIDAINELKGTIESVQGDVVTIKTSVGTSLSTTVSAIQGKVTSIENGIATLSIPDLGAITTKLSSIDAVLGSVAGDVVTLKTSIGDVTTTVSALNGKVVSIENGVATIQTDVGTLQGVVTEVKNGVATISTGIGNVQASVSNLQPDVVAAKDNSASISTMVYVAVAFAVIAAIAAVASILLMRKKIAS